MMKKYLTICITCITVKIFQINSNTYEAKENQYPTRRLTWKPTINTNIKSHYDNHYLRHNASTKMITSDSIFSQTAGSSSEEVEHPQLMIKCSYMYLNSIFVNNKLQWSELYWIIIY